jgi:spermidine dehydrogenase
MREQFKSGRRQLLEMTFEAFETPMRDELSRILGPGGFDFDRDIAAIVVNRWPHGYAYTPDPLWDDPAETERLVALGRRKIGQIAIASSDAGWDAYTDVAIREAHRAVEDLGA